MVANLDAVNMGYVFWRKGKESVSFRLILSLDMRHIQYQGETLPPSPFPLVLAFHLVLGKFHIYLSHTFTVTRMHATMSRLT